MNDVAIVYSDYYKDISDGLIKGIEANLDPKFSIHKFNVKGSWEIICLLYTSPSPRDRTRSRMPSSA